MGKAERETQRKKEEASLAADAVQSSMGNFGKWQLWIVFWIAVLKLPVAWHQLGIVFLAPPVESWCARPPALHNISIDHWKNISQPPLAMDPSKRDSCRMYDMDYTGFGPPSNNTRTIACSSWEYDRSIFQETIVTQWDLVCNRKQLANVAQTVLMFGVLVGNVVFGMASDRFGRKMPLIVAGIMQVLFGSACAFMPWFEGFLVMRFITACAIGGSMITSFVLCMEVLGGWWRMAISVLFHIPFSMGHSLMAAIAYYARDWHTFQLAVSIPSVFLILYWWVLPESPRWLLAVGRDEEAIKILEDAARCNKLDTSTIAQKVESVSIHKTKHMEDENKKANILDLFRTPNMRVKTLCMYFNWVVCGLCFYGLAQYMGQIGGNIFVNVAISGLIELPGMSFCIYLMGRFGRRATLFSSQMLAAVSCLLIMAVPQEEPEWPRVTLAALGIVGMSVSFPAVYLYSAELFPTVVRNVGVGSSSMCARIGSMVAPYITSLSMFGFYFPPLAFGLVPLTGALLCLLLPETANADLPDTLEDGENFGKKKRKVESGTTNNGYVTEDSPL